MLEYWSVRITLACVLVFVVQQALPEDFTAAIILVSADVAAHPWTIVTSMFAHDGFAHIFYNMFALLLFGSILEKVIGGKRFLAVYFGAGIAGSFASIPLYTATLGASGAIFGVMGTLAVLRPRKTVYVSYVPMPMIIAVFVWMMIDLVGLLAPSGIANSAHLAGLGFGLVSGVFLRKDYAEEKVVRERPPKISEREFRRWENRWLIGRRA